MTNILTIAQDAAIELSLDEPTTIVNTAVDSAGRKLFRHLLAICKQLSGMDWAELRREHTFTTEAAVTQSSGFPADFLRFVPNTFFNRTKRWRVNGPMSPEEWQADRSTLVTRVHDSFIQRGTSMLLSPTPPAGETMAYEYITKYIGTNDALDTGRERFTSDNDVPYLDAELITLGVVWSYRKAEGLDYGEEFRKYEMRKAQLFAASGSRRVINMGATDYRRNPVAPIVPDTLTELI